MSIATKLKRLANYRKELAYYYAGRAFLEDETLKSTTQKTLVEKSKCPSRTEIINYLLKEVSKTKNYLEIGVRDPRDNFLKIIADFKVSVDPGLEFKENPVDYKMTSDEFFSELGKGRILSPNIRFGVVFIDGLHTAEQVDKDIVNALKYVTDDGFIVLHDCNPPSEWHARENYRYCFTPAGHHWNGTTWKAFQKWRHDTSVQSCCIDTDWGVGVLSKTQSLGVATNNNNQFFTYSELEANRKSELNLMSFDELRIKLLQTDSPR